MPRFDGTGPLGSGPLTGRGEGYCAVAQTKTGRAYGCAGLSGRPTGSAVGRRLGGFLRLGRRLGRGMRRGLRRG